MTGLHTVQSRVLTVAVLAFRSICDQPSHAALSYPPRRLAPRIIFVLRKKLWGASSTHSPWSLRVERNRPVDEQLSGLPGVRFDGEKNATLFKYAFYNFDIAI